MLFPRHGRKDAGDRQSRDASLISQSNERIQVAPRRQTAGKKQNQGEALLGIAAGLVGAL